MDVLCKKCRKKLFSRNLINDQGCFAMDPDDGLPLQTENGQHFFVCPHCHVRNIVVEAPAIGGLPQMRISHAK